MEEKLFFENDTDMDERVDITSLNDVYGAISDADVPAINAYLTSYAYWGITEPTATYLLSQLTSYSSYSYVYDHVIWHIPGGAGMNRDAAIAYIQEKL